MYMMGTDGGGLHRVSSGRGRTTCGYFFDQDRRIFYSSTEHAGAACPPRPDYSRGYVWALYDYDIYTANADGSGARRLTTNPAYDAEGTLSPDGQTIVFTSLRHGDLDIYTMRVDGTGVRRLTTKLCYDGGPFFSPDAKLLMRTSDRHGTVPRATNFFSGGWVQRPWRSSGCDPSTAAPRAGPPRSRSLSSSGSCCGRT